ncbi:MAG: MoaF N-terminal domain-containing protein [Dehalococcoidales bacterium]|nr:MoaF N-terminal domain-containing protein [Dehalococcoidales bacterium]
MDFFKSTFFNHYTPLTDAQIAAKLKPPAAPVSVSPLSNTLSGKSLKIVLDGGMVLEYKFEKDKLTFKEGAAAAVTAPYAAKELNEIILFTHLIPGTVRGYGVVYDTKTNLVTAYELWFCGFDKDKREVWRDFKYGYVDIGALAPQKRHALTNRIEGKGTYWKNDNGVEMLYFFPSVVWSSFVELSDPLGGITITAPSDYIKINDRLYIYSRVEHEYSGTFTLEVIDLFTIRHIGMRLGFDKNDALDYSMYYGEGEITGQSTNLEPLSDYGTVIPLGEEHSKTINPQNKGVRPVYRPRFMHKDYTQAEVDEIVKTNSKIFEGRSIMSSKNTMEPSDYMVGKQFTLRYDDGPAWEYDITSISELKWCTAGEKSWHTEKYEGYEAAKDIIIFSHICTGSKPLRNLTHAIDFSKALTTCVDAQLGNGRKPWEVGHKAFFGVMDLAGGPVPPAVVRHGFTTELVGKAFSWTYSDMMMSIHVYSTPDSYSWTIMLEKNAGGWMWSSPCLYVKLRDDAYLMSWTEDTCNGNQGTFVVNPRIMHDGGFFFGVGESPNSPPDVHLTPMGAFARPLHGFDILKYFGKK